MLQNGRYCLDEQRDEIDYESGEIDHDVSLAVSQGLAT
jgi:hypothetical protein